MNPAPVTPPPAPPSHTAVRQNSPARAEPESPARRKFEQLLSARDSHADAPSEDAAPASDDDPEVADWGLLPPALRMRWEEGSSADDEASSGPGSLAMHAGAPANHVAEPAPVVAPPPAPVPTGQADLYARLASPPTAAGDSGRFEVLDGSLVSAVEVDTRVHGSMTVTVAASAQHVGLLERQLPQLQRRLSEKVSTHLRVEERTRRDR